MPVKASNQSVMPVSPASDSNKRLIIDEQADASLTKYRSVLIDDPPNEVGQDQRLVIYDAFYQAKETRFIRYGPKRSTEQDERRDNNKNHSVEPNYRQMYVVRALLLIDRGPC